MKKRVDILLICLTLITVSCIPSNAHNSKKGDTIIEQLQLKIVSKSDTTHSNCFEAGPGEIITEKIPGYGVAISMINYDNDKDMDFIEGVDNTVFISTNTQDTFDCKICDRVYDNEGIHDILNKANIASSDFNNDGYEDFILGGKQGIIRLFLNNESEQDIPRFDMTEICDFGQPVYGLTIADFNEDGLQDFAASHNTNSFTYSIITIFYNQGNQNFIQKDIFHHDLTEIIDLESGDFDNDGDIDLIYTYNEYIVYDESPLNLIGVCKLLRNNGDETFDSEKIIFTRGHDLFFFVCLNFYRTIHQRVRDFLGLNRFNLHLTSADYDNDGDIDILVGDNSGSVEHFINDGEGNFDSNGIFHQYGFLSWGLTSGDYDNDGDIDIFIAASKEYGSLLGDVWIKNNQLV